MKRKILLTIGILFTVTVCTNATVLTFDDISTRDSYQIPNGYGGFDWGDLFDGGAFYFLNAKNYSYDSGYKNGLISGDYVAFPTTYGHESIGWLSSTNLFTFTGAYFTAVWRDGLNIQVDGYLNDAPIYSTTVTVDTTGPTWYEFNYANIDKLRFSASGGTHHDGYVYNDTQFAIDNFTYTPEPASILLLFFGGVILRRFNH